MLSITDLRNGTLVEIDGDPHIVINYSHHKMGRGGAVVKTKLKNLKTGATYERSFHGNDKLDQATLDEKQASFLYKEGNKYLFMDSSTYEQFELPDSVIADSIPFLAEGIEVKVMFFDGLPIALNLPIKMEFKVTHTEPGVKGDTAQGGTKPATIETGASIIVPLFVNIGDVIRVDTRNSSYIERVK
ncbi:MAG: elongation factor P [Patescibacteria group bacterium]|jgi:elongation factor P